ncbi:SAV_2336 N-terminal domain-related protein [Streptomyces sp. NPDC020742]|uniref:SAV_2336 N-terminal domain-related protein n=1 Tax=unclassified Streptomyces TaxID=2593676 RepID=UPI0033C1B481
MSIFEAAPWLITAAPAAPVAPARGRGQHTTRTVFAPAPDGWPSALPLPAAEAAVSALQALGQPQPEGTGVRHPAADAYAIPAAPGPVSPPASDPQVQELVLVADTGLSMSAWYPTVNAFAASACELPLFNDVHLVMLRSQSSTTAEDLVDRKEVARLGLDREAPPHRRKTVFVITDAVGAAWKRGLVWRELRAWAQHHTVAILQVLPHHDWSLSGIHTRPRLLRALVPGCPNSELEVARPGDVPVAPRCSAPETDEQRLLIPVLEIRKRWLDQWVRLMTSRRWVPQQALEVPVAAGLVPAPGSAPDAERSPEQRITEFRTAASDNAFTLAVLLAAAPLNRHVMQLIAAELLPAAGPGDLAAVLTSGLLISVENAAEQDDPHDQVVFDFAPEVRKKLLSLGESAKTRRVVGLLDRYLGPHVPSIRGISQRVKNPATAPPPEITPQAPPYLRVECEVLSALSGGSTPHREAAELLQTKIEEFAAADARREAD